MSVFFTDNTAQLHGTYFKYEDEDERETLDVFQRFPDSSLGTNENKVRVAQDLLAFAIQRKTEQRKKLTTKAMKKLFPSLSKGMIEVVRDPTAKPLALHPTPENIEEADLLNILD
eukprot:jgi/Psemu1/52923/gm1.52923_g